MRLAGFLLLLAGWFLVLATLVLLKPGLALNVFILVAIGVEVVGLIVLARSHLTSRGDRG